MIISAGFQGIDVLLGPSPHKVFQMSVKGVVKPTGVGQPTLTIVDGDPFNVSITLEVECRKKKTKKIMYDSELLI